VLYPTRFYLPPPAPPADAVQIAAAAERILNAERPVIVAGNGVRIAQAYDQLRQLAETAGLPVATTAAGKGTFPETHPLALGVFGTFGTPTANACLGEADLVLVVGSKLSPSDTAWENTKLLDPTRQSFVQIDIEPKNASWNFPAETVVLGDAAQILGALTEAVKARAQPARGGGAAGVAASRGAGLFQCTRLYLEREADPAAAGHRRVDAQPA
jgi:acetolactate synthase-1/2/3 large subunit